MNKLFEITNGSEGESYVRCYAWAPSAGDAERMAREANGWTGALQSRPLFAADAAPFATMATDHGWPDAAED